jgi:hypothetical protein
MMKKLQSRGGHPERRIAVRLESGLDRRLLAYGTAAAAAGVGILALACPAEAKIIYTHANEQIAPNKAFPLDLNHDKRIDFMFVDSHVTSTFGGGWGVLSIFPDRSANEIWGSQTAHGFRRYASALGAGVRVGPKGRFSPGAMIMAHSSLNNGARNNARKTNSSYCYGPWKHATNLYLGLKFSIKGTTHYGWARLNVSCSNQIVTATLTGYAYESIANKPILTGKTRGQAEDSVIDSATPGTIAPPSATLGLLAMGSPGVSVWRRK